jgi:hypothetical protein
VAPRSWPNPDGSKTVHAIGDVHIGVINTARRAQFRTDMLSSKLLPSPAARVQIGDGVETWTLTNDTNFNDYMASLPEDAPYYAIIGNHDLYPDTRSGEQAMDAWSWQVNTSRNWTVSLGFVRLIGIGPNDLLGASNPNIILQSDTLAFLDDTLTASTEDCIIFCHAPLFGTVEGDIGTHYVSTEAGFFARENVDILAVLDAQPKAKVWVAGHTHSPLSAPGFVELHDIGARNIVSVNVSALYYTGRQISQILDPLCSIFITYDPPNVEIRARDHGGRCWTTIDGSRVTSVAIPA